MWQTWFSFIIASILFVVALLKGMGTVYWAGNLIIAFLTLWASLLTDTNRSESKKKETPEKETPPKNE